MYFQADITTTIPLSLKIYQKINDNWKGSSVDIPTGESKSVFVSKYIDNGATLVWCRIDASNQPVNSTFYVDNIKVYQ